MEAPQEVVQQPVLPSDVQQLVLTLVSEFKPSKVPTLLCFGGFVVFVAITMPGHAVGCLMRLEVKRHFHLPVMCGSGEGRASSASSGKYPTPHSSCSFLC